LLRLADDRLDRCHVEARRRARVAGGPLLLDAHEERVAVAVEGGRAHVLTVAARVALAPELLAAARPEGHPSLGEGAAQRLGVHVAEHEHLTGVVLLDDRGQQPGVVETGPGDRLIRVHRTSIPALASACFTSPMVSSPLWKTEAASTASAPACTAGAKWWAAPAPPEAMTGTLESSRMARTSSRSKPSFVPSASIELTSSSPAPRSIASRAHSSASRSVSVRPPWVVTTKPEGVRGERFTSSESTHTWAPKRPAISSMRAGRAIAAELTPILSAPCPSRRATSSTERMPPPTVSGMNTCSAVAVTVS